jgi:hypothetical protein
MTAPRRARLFAVLLAATTAVSADAATLGVAWDPSPDSTVTGYRVFVGTVSGQQAEFFDVARAQRSFMYTSAVEGRRYYFAVAALANGVVGARSEEVSAVAGGVGALQPPPQSPASPPSQIPPEFWLTYDAGRRGGSSRSGLTPGAVEAVASGLADVTALAVLPTGGGLLVEAGVRVRAFSDQGVVGIAALEMPEGTRIAAIAADPGFASTGLVFVAEARPAADGREDVFVVRHRLLGGALGESAAVAVGRHQPVGAVARLAITDAGHVVLAQAGHVMRFEPGGRLTQDGLVAAPPRWATGLGEALALAAQLGGAIEPAAGDRLADVSVAMVNGTTTIALASPTTVFRFDLEASQLSAGTSVADHGTVVSVASASSNTDYVVVREPAAGGGDAATFALLRVQHADSP